MAKITTIIDIGSNSMRMVVFKKNSRFGFHLINESKSKVKISENSYTNNGNLQELPMLRAFDTLKSFLNISSNIKSRKILCVATSALRDAPNKKEIISKVSKQLKLNIKIIVGKKEAYYGGVATSNLLPNKNFTTIDIGGGSTEFAIVENSKIIDTISLKIGTVRLKELYFNQNNLDGAKQYIHTQLKNITYQIQDIVGLGGSARAISRIILKQSNYPLDILHGFEYSVLKYSKLFENLIYAKDNKELKELGVDKDRYDTIIIGTFIWKTILN
jgi:exopolyphosphatase/guanosine-5'-triphosphate,3'-diphosphate pyrophosphatase